MSFLYSMEEFLLQSIPSKNLLYTFNFHSSYNKGQAQVTRKYVYIFYVFQVPCYLHPDFSHAFLG